jgi:uncharacterized protein (TIGR02145 family)
MTGLALGIVAGLLLFGCGDNGAGSGGGGGGGGSDGVSKGGDGSDGGPLKTVTIGNQVWMAKNLNIETDDSWCSNCDKYGRLYRWADAMTVCPAGWHLPSEEEWLTLIDYIGGYQNAGKKLKSKSGWRTDNIFEGGGNGTDEYGFSALPGGWRDRIYGFGGQGQYGYWWTATEFTNITDSTDCARYIRIVYHTPMIGTTDYKPDAVKGYWYSVRCVAD